MSAPHDEDTLVLQASLGTTYTVPRVNLMPPEIIEIRRFRRTQRILGGCVVGVLAAVGGGYVLAQQRADSAAQELAAAQTQTSQLRSQEARYAEVPRVTAEVETAKSARDQALATNVAWHGYLDELAAAYPQGVWLESLTANVAGPGGTTGEAPVPVAGSNPLATPGIGTVTFTGSALDHSNVASWLDMLAGTDGFADAYLTSSERTSVDGQTVVNFTSQVVVTADALWDRYQNEAR
jgi:Tfp pilus assembly protein PilN